eukprot:3008322-Amphidinium_carterae.1
MSFLDGVFDSPPVFMAAMASMKALPSSVPNRLSMPAFRQLEVIDSPTAGKRCRFEFSEDKCSFNALSLRNSVSLGVAWRHEPFLSAYARRLAFAKV